MKSASPDNVDSGKPQLMPPTFAPWTPTQPPSRQIAVLMSGGVDSSVTAHLLKRDGWDVLGVTIKIPVACGAGARGCCGADAAFVCDELGLPHYFIDATDAFNQLIVEPFRKVYSLGQTPNPCVDCNSLLKFSLVWDILQRTFGISHLATGHYASVAHQDGQVYLRRAKDKGKDQSYFLYGIAADRLPCLILPLGDLNKNQVREIASRSGLPVADKAESMELCFAGEQDYRVALSAEDACRPGDIVNMQGTKLGTHKGIANYTLGQRRGLGFAGGKPLYVASIDARTNTVVLGTRDEVSSRTVRASNLNVLQAERFTTGTALSGKIRSYGDPLPCRVTEADDDTLAVEFDKAQFAPCPGQRLVLYDDRERIVAGGTILAPGLAPRHVQADGTQAPSADQPCR